MMKRYSGLPQFALNKKKEVVVAGDSYIRRISKYEIDRNEIDFNKLRREKEADRTKNVKINKQIIDHNLDGRH